MTPTELFITGSSIVIEDRGFIGIPLRRLFGVSTYSVLHGLYLGTRIIYDAVPEQMTNDMHFAISNEAVASIAKSSVRLVKNSVKQLQESKILRSEAGATARWIIFNNQNIIELYNIWNAMFTDSDMVSLVRLGHEGKQRIKAIMANIEAIIATWE